MEDPITIIGAGIGGLTAALALQNKGFNTKVYESASEIKPVGAGIIMANNAMQIFKQLGISQKIESAGHKISALKLTDESMKTISKLDLSDFESKYGVFNVAIHRAELQKILVEEVGDGNIIRSKRLIKIEEAKSIALSFEDNTLLESKMVIGADGLHSTVRRQVFGPCKIRDVRQVCWRGVFKTSLAEKYEQEAVEIWGTGKRFGFVKISNDHFYWFAVINDGLNSGAGLAELFKEFHPDIQEMISQTPAEDIFQSRILDLKPILKWYKGNICLLGDAAHATTPNLGQGACQAVEDAYSLAQLLSSGKSINEAFANYQKARIKKARYIVNTSYRLGKFAHIENHFIVWLRNHLMAAIPRAVSLKQLEKVFSVDYLDRR